MLEIYIRVSPFDNVTDPHIPTFLNRRKQLSVANDDLALLAAPVISDATYERSMCNCQTSNNYVGLSGTVRAVFSFINRGAKYRADDYKGIYLADLRKQRVLSRNIGDACYFYCIAQKMTKFV